MDRSYTDYVKCFAVWLYDAGHSVIPFNNGEFERAVEAVRQYVCSNPRVFGEKYDKILKLLEIDSLTTRHERLLFNIRELFGKVLLLAKDQVDSVSIQIDDEYLQFLRSDFTDIVPEEVRDTLVNLFWEASQNVIE